MCADKCLQVVMWWGMFGCGFMFCAWRFAVRAIGSDDGMNDAKGEADDAKPSIAQTSAAAS